MRLILFCFVFLLASGCDKPDNSAYERKQLQIENNHLAMENAKLTNELKEAKAQLQRISAQTPDLKTSVQQALTTYAYVKITYQIREFGSNGKDKTSQSFVYTSDIQPVVLWNDDSKYKLMDQESSRLRKNANIVILDRDAYNFTSYSDASKSLEQVDQL